MSLRGITSRVRCRDVLLCYDSSAASDVQCLTLCSIRWSCRWLCHVSITATQHSQGFLRPSFVDFSRCLTPPPIHRSSRYEHVIPILQGLHWLRSPERIDFKLAVLVYRCLHGLAPRHLSDYIQRVADCNSRRLRSSSSSQLVIRRTRLSTVGDRAFPVDLSRLWNSLLPDVTSAPTLTVFQNRLKTYLFSR